MKIKALISSLIAVSCLAFIACDDDLNSVGSGIRPDNDDIFIGVDSVSLTAKTVSLNSSVYARADRALLGEYKDDMYGGVLSDYLCEFYSSVDSKFQDKAFKIDSVRLYVISSSFLGDQSKLMGLSAYAVSNPLEEDLYTDINPADYADLSKAIGQGSFIFKDAPRIDPTNRPATHRMLRLNVDTIIGRRFLNEWKTNPETFTEQLPPGSKPGTKSKFQLFFPGVYITPTFGDEALMGVQQTILGVYYKYTGRNHDDTTDSIRVSSLELDVTARVVQMNRVEQQIDPSMVAPNDKMTYLKSPAGLYTELNIPLKDILTKVGEGRTLNSASFYLRGFSEEEEKSSYKKPDYLLFVNKDSMDVFFTKKLFENHKSSFIMKRDTVNNVYQFYYDGGNINTMISHYKEEYEKKGIAVANIPDLKYVLLPVERLASQETATLPIGIYNLMEPRSAILRTDEENMRMRLIFSKYASHNKKRSQ